MKTLNIDPKPLNRSGPLRRSYKFIEYGEGYAKDINLKTFKRDTIFSTYIRLDDTLYNIHYKVVDRLING